MSKSIVVSGPPAIGKTTVAKGLAKEFDLNYLSGGDILKELASEQGFSSSGDDWWDTEDGMKFLNQRKENSEFDKNNPIMSTGNPFPRKYSTSYSDSKKSGKMFRQDSAYSRSFAPYLTGDLFRDVSASSKPKENEFSIGWNKEADKIEHLRKQGRILASKSNPLSPQVVMKIMPHITNFFTKILVSGSQDITIRDKK